MTNQLLKWNPKKSEGEGGLKIQIMITTLTNGSVKHLSLIGTLGVSVGEGLCGVHWRLKDIAPKCSSKNKHLNSKENIVFACKCFKQLRKYIKEALWSILSWV